MPDAFLDSLKGDDWPQITASSIDDAHASIEMIVPATLTWFQGHFPGHPVLPGVVQVHVAATLGTGLFSISAPFSGVDSLKFQRIISPGRALTLKLDFDAATNKVAFSFHDDEGRCSTGRLLFGQ